MAKLTQAMVTKAWRERGPGRVTLTDDMVPGLRLAVGQRLASWQLRYRVDGGHKTATLGSLLTMDLAAARADAVLARNRIAKGGDPLADQRAAKAAVVAQRHETEAVKIATLGDLLGAYLPWLANRPKSPKHLRDETRYAAQAVEALGPGMKLVALKAHHVADMLAASGSLGRKRHGPLSRLLAWGATREHVATNVAERIDKADRPKPAPARTRRPDLETIRAVYAAAGWIAPGGHHIAPYAGTAADLVRFMALVPCRSIEASRMEWPHIDLKARLWLQPAKTTKTGEAYVVPLTEPVIEILERRRAAHGHLSPLVFPGSRTGRQANSWAKLLTVTHKASGTTGWSWHDLRRSFVSELAERGHAESVLDACLNHRQSATRSGVMASYQQSARLRERRLALEAWADLITGAEPIGNVIPFGAAS